MRQPLRRSSFNTIIKGYRAFQPSAWPLAGLSSSPEHALLPTRRPEWRQI